MSASARQRKHELLREAILLLAFHFHSVLLIFVNLWPISTLRVADMVHAVADMVCGRYRLWPISSFTEAIAHFAILQYHSAGHNLLCLH